MDTLSQAETERLNPFVRPEIAKLVRIWCAEDRISQGELVERLVLAEQARRAAAEAPNA